MHLNLARGHRLYVSIQEPDSLLQLAYASAEIADCYLHRAGRWSLWVGAAAFDVGDSEADQIQGAYPQIHVDRTEAVNPFGSVA